MKELIYAIPILEAFEANTECPFCEMAQRIEQDVQDFVLGNAYMEEDFRAQTDQTGFCQAHLQQLYVAHNKLGLALMASTHLPAVFKALFPLMDQVQQGEPVKKSFFQKKVAGTNSLIAYLTDFEKSCYVCERVQQTFQRYMENYFYMWQSQPEIIESTKQSKGFCLPHLEKLLIQGETQLKPMAYKQFLDIVIPLEKIHLQRLEEELLWFIDKFDYRFQNEPWKNSKDALPRVLQKISGIAYQKRGDQ